MEINPGNDANTRGRPKSSHPFWKAICLVALVATAVGVLSMISDIKRYIRISTM